ncbi:MULTISPECIES: hypothetical protein [Actinomycetes]|uniref:hypothetical protein n=1 Tax=Actinomycetes TaxID=1760 RepID=UPI0001B54093|nr:MULTISPECIES: hypothetical protein [Actinomycetes]EFL09986.1 predicted protein [Streptomyces sp. AA4]
MYGSGGGGLPPSTAAGAPAALALTGFNTLAFLLTALVLLVVGAFLVRSARLRRNALD